ncbi:MAG: DedA family protein [Mycobacteriales bacterium]
MQHIIENYGYLAVFLLMLAESACIPVPSEVTMLFAGAIAGGAVSGTHLSIVAVIILGTLGNVVGSYVAWAVGRYAGQAALHRWGRRIWLREDDIDKAHRWFERYGDWSVFLARLLPVVRTFISLPAGFAAMPPIRFGVLTSAGCLPWTAALAIAGYEIGGNWDRVANGFHGPTYAIAAIVVVACVVAVVLFLRRRRRVAQMGLTAGDGRASEE